MVNCPKCGVKVQIPPGITDKAFKCSRCQAVFKVATPPSTAAAPPPATDPPKSTKDEPSQLPPRQNRERSTNVEEQTTKFNVTPLDSLALTLGSVSLLIGWFPLFGLVISGPGLIIGLVASLNSIGMSPGVRRLVVVATVVSLLTGLLSIIVPAADYLHSKGAFDTDPSAAEFADAKTEAVDCGDATVLIRSVKRLRQPISNNEEGSGEALPALLVIQIRVENRSQNEPLVYLP